MDRNQPCNCGSRKKYKKCCGFESSSKNKKNKFLILFLTFLLILGAGYGFMKVMDKNRVSANPNATYCPDCGRYH